MFFQLVPLLILCQSQHGYHDLKNTYMDLARKPNLLWSRSQQRKGCQSSNTLVADTLRGCSKVGP